MINRYEGNTGRVTRLPEAGDLRPPAPPPPGPPRAPAGRRPPMLPDLKGLLPNGLGAFETEDLLLLLVLYLMYRESGDQELLIIMGAMFLL